MEKSARALALSLLVAFTGGQGLALGGPIAQVETAATHETMIDPAATDLDLQAIPEPTTIGLLGLGALGLAYELRRRQRRQDL